MIVTPKQLAAELAVTDQAATGMLRQLRAAGIAREATGRQSFRAFCLRL
jgi:DNA-binding MarR family transcriptional regulator